MGSTGDGDAHNGFIATPRKHRNRGSGGFLLDSPAGQLSPAQSLLSSSKQDRKGKRKSINVETIARKRDDHHNNVNGSPLSKELRLDSYNGEPRLPGSGGSSVSRDGSLRQDGRPVSGSMRNGSNFGFDTESVRIVDMALRLSEGRRRQASDKRHVSTDISGRGLGIAVPPTASHGVAENLVQPPLQGPGELSLQRHTVGSYPPKEPWWASLSEPATDDDLVTSKATLGRAEKAKRYIELAHEHRRLLPHLPPIRRPGARSLESTAEADNKAYNPLQYARNRKLRLREKSGLTAEADGWHDVAKVRAWVDAAIDSHAETQHDPTECVRLPPFSQQDDEVELEDHSLPNSPQSKQAARPRRPKSDWITNPGDLLADAYWLEQGLNKTRIQDRHHRTIYPPDTHFKYAGWGQQAAPVSVPETVQNHTPPAGNADPRPAPASPLADAPALPMFRSAHEKGDKSRHLRRAGNLKKSLIDDAKVSTKRALEIFENTSDSSSSSASTSSDSDEDTDGGHRGRRRGLSQAFKFKLPDGDPFSLPTFASRQLNNVSDTDGASRSLRVEDKFTHQNIASSPVNQKSDKKFERQNSAGDKDRPANRRLPFGKRNLSEDLSRSSGEYDTLSPASPVNYGLPSIAINLSPTESRSPSPTKKGRRMFDALLDKNHGQDRERVETLDFAKTPFKTHSRDPSTDADRSRNGSGNESRGTSPLNKSRRGSSSYITQESTRSSHRGSTMSRTSTKSNATSAEHHSRIRGMFKGGRIAEIVGTEVSKVGDYIWKRDPPAGRQSTSISEVSNHSGSPSGSDDETYQNGTLYKTPPQKRRGSTSSTSTRTDPRTSMDRSEQKGQFHNPNLPSFTSPFQRDREKQDRQREETAPGSQVESGGDHISLQVKQHRSRSKSPRLDRLAPPKLNTSGSPNDQMDGYAFDESKNLSKSRSASQAYNDAINGKSTQHTRDGVSDQALSERPVRVSRSDLFRIETLLLISAVKANAILCASRPTSNKLGDSLRSQSSTQVVPLRQSEDQIRAARDLISTISKHNGVFYDKLQNFSKTTVSNLHGELQFLEDNIENKLTPRARAAADQAGELGMKLTTTSVLAVKGLNDIISEAFRLRKRGPFRWLRSLGYGAIEWTVVGLLWVIWAVVTIIQLFLGTFRLCTRFVRWMLWIN